MQLAGHKDLRLVGPEETSQIFLTHFTSHKKKWEVGSLPEAGTSRYVVSESGLGA